MIIESEDVIFDFDDRAEKSSSEMKGILSHREQRLIFRNKTC